MPSAPFVPDALELLRLFYVDPESHFGLEPVPPEDVPPPYDRLLVHDNHMTVTVELFHDCEVDVEVLAVHETDRHYARKILLKKQSDGTVVQFGIVRLNRALLPPAAWQGIESQQVPLGRVLIENEVLRHVELVSICRISPSTELARLFGHTTPSLTYGRTALIHVHDLPAVELLEIVAPLS